MALQENIKISELTSITSQDVNKDDLLLISHAINNDDIIGTQYYETNNVTVGSFTESLSNKIQQDFLNSETWEEVKEDISSKNDELENRIANKLQDETNKLNNSINRVEQTSNSNYNTIVNAVNSKLDEFKSDIEQSKDDSNPNSLAFKIKCIEDELTNGMPTWSTRLDTIVENIEATKQEITQNVNTAVADVGVQLNKINDNITKLSDNSSSTDASVEKLLDTVFPTTYNYSFNVGSTSVVVEYGNPYPTQNRTLTWSGSKSREGISTPLNIQTLTVTQGDKILTTDSSLREVVAEPFNTNTTFKCDALYEGTKDGVISRTVTVTFIERGRYYWGCVPESTQISEIVSFIESGQLVKSSGLCTTRSVELIWNQNDACNTYVYPKSLGALTSIKDDSNAEQLGSYTKGEITYKGHAFYVYKLTSASTLENYKLIYK